MEWNPVQTEMIKKCIRGEDLPITWQKEMNIQPRKLFTVIVKEFDGNDCDVDVDGSLMPPEDQISDELIKAVENSGESLERGDFVDCASEKERDDLFHSIWGNGCE